MYQIHAHTAMQTDSTHWPQASTQERNYKLSQTAQRLAVTTDRRLAATNRQDRRLAKPRLAEGRRHEKDDRKIIRQVHKASEESDCKLGCELHIYLCGRNPVRTFVCGVPLWFLDSTFRES